MKVISLASSSAYGNAYLVGYGSTHVLVDCGMPIRRLEKSLQALQIDPRALAGIFISHEHGDHVRALQLRTPFPTKYNVPSYSSHLLWSGLGNCGHLPSGLCKAMEHGETVQAGELTVAAFKKSHDAIAPLGFRLTTPEGTSVAVVTDLGEVTADVVGGAIGCDYLVFESNHDRDMELNSGRPWALIRRVMGKYGHLSNAEAGDALAEIITENTKGIMLAHLSLHCNTPTQALQTVSSYLRRLRYEGVLTVASAWETTVLVDTTKERIGLG